MTYFVKKHKTAILLLLMVAGIFAGTLRSMSDADIWFQLLAGKYVLQHGAVPHTDFFIYSSNNAPQMFGGWGFGLIYEIAIEAFGLPAATFVNSAIWTLTFLFAISAAFKRVNIRPTEASAVQLMLLMIAISAIFIIMALRMSMRAESTLVLAWSASIWLFETFKKEKIKWFLIGLPLIAWAEAWLHTGGFFLLLLIPVCLAKQMEQRPLTAKHYACWALSLAVMLALPVLNPNGAMQVYTQFKSILGIILAEAKDPIATFTQSSGLTYNLEYIPIWDPRATAIWPKFIVLFLLTLVVSIRRPRLGWVIEVLLCWACLCIAIMHIRGISIAGMVLMVPAIEVALSAPATKFKNHIAACFALTILLSFAPLAISYTQGNLSIQGATNVLAHEALMTKKIQPNGGNIFTNEIGPQLLYAIGDERFKVARGGHTIIANNAVESHFMFVMQGLDGWVEELDKMHVNFVALPFYIALPGEGMLYWLPSQLVGREDWKLNLQNNGIPIFSRMPPGEKLSEEQVESQTYIYLRNMQIYGKYALYGREDVLGNEISAIALKKIKEIEKKQKEREEKKHDN